MIPKTPERDENATERQPLSIDVGVKFSPFLVTLSHIKLDQLGIVSRFILSALSQDGIFWSHLEQVVGLDRRSLKPIEERLIGLGYLDAEGQLSDLGRIMADVVRLMESPKKVWIDACSSEQINKRRLIILDEYMYRDNSAIDKRVIYIGEADNQDGLNRKQRKKQCEDVEFAISYWRRKELFVDVLKRIWPSSRGIFDNKEVLNDVDVEFSEVAQGDGVKSERAIKLSVNLTSEAEKGWLFYQPVMVCQRDIKFSDSIPEFIGQPECMTESRCIGLLNKNSLCPNTVLVKRTERYGRILDNYSESDEKSAIEIIRDYFKGASTPDFADIHYSFQKQYSPLILAYDQFYKSAIESLDALPVSEPYKRYEE